MAGESSLLSDSGVENQERMFKFVSEIGLLFIRESEYWYADETFKVCPEIFYQLYIIPRQRKGQMFPVVFCLLPNKTQAAYRRLLQQVFDRVGDNQLQDALRACCYQCIPFH